LVFILRKAIDSDLEKIKIYAESFNLDSEDLEPQKLYIAEKAGVLAGFGRYKNYRNIYEISTIGALKEFRRMGAGTIIVEQLIKSAFLDEIWLTTVFPEYFQKFGFKKTNNNLPEELVLKTKKLCKKYNKSLEFNIYMKLDKATLSL